jgi:fructokinase
MQQMHLFPMIRDEVQQLLNGYINIPAITDTIDTYIVPASFGNKSGILGVLALAQHASHI